MADLHIGSSAYIKMNIDEFTLLHNIINNANTNKADFIFISGDIYDTLPNKSTINRVNEIFSYFKGKIFIIYGNHDFEVGVHDIEYPENVYVFDSEFSSYYFEDYNLRVWGYSYDERFIKTDIYSDYFKDNPVNNEEINILLAHGGTENQVPCNFSYLSKTFDYVAFGHYHYYQTPFKNVIFPGSIIPMSSREPGEHGYILGEMSENRTYTFIPTMKKYVELDIYIDGYNSIEKLYNDIAYSLDENNRYIITLRGFRSSTLIFDLNHLASISNVEKIIDQTKSSYDYGELKRYNKNNILGKFIERLEKSDDPLAKKALDFGVKAFLEAKDAN